MSHARFHAYMVRTYVCTHECIHIYLSLSIDIEGGRDRCIDMRVNIYVHVCVSCAHARTSVINQYVCYAAHVQLYAQAHAHICEFELLRIHVHIHLYRYAHILACAWHAVLHTC